VHVKSKLAIALVIALALAAGATAAAPPGEVPALTRVASRLSGIKASHRVTVRVVSVQAMTAVAQRLLDRDYPPEQQAYDETVYRGLGLLGPTTQLRPVLLRIATTNVIGLYDPVNRVLYVRRGSSRRAATLHGLVHALEDQAFNLRRMTGLRRSDRDAALAATAAVEGDAEFASTLLGGRSLAFAPRRLAALPGTPIGNFLRLEQQFPDTVGLRFVTTLHNLGGNRAVFSALRQFPATTEQVFHMDAFLTREPALPVQLPTAAAGFALQGSDTFGELDVRALLAVFQVPRLDVAGEGWGGGRSAVYADAAGDQAVALVLQWDTELDAQEWQEAFATYVNEAFDADTPGFPATTACAVDTCWSVGGRRIAFARNGSRTAVVLGPSVDAAAALAAAATR
jgi:hypothetical protein